MWSKTLIFLVKYNTSSGPLTREKENAASTKVEVPRIEQNGALTWAVFKKNRKFGSSKSSMITHEWTPVSSSMEQPEPRDVVGWCGSASISARLLWSEMLIESVPSLMALNVKG